MEMLDGVPELTLEFLNEVTQAWLEIEYNRRPHREIGCSPVNVSRRPATCCGQSFLGRPARRVPHGGHQNSASKRRDDLAGRRAFRDPRTVSPLPQGLGAVRPLGPPPGRSGRPAQRNHSLAPVSVGSPSQRRRPAIALERVRARDDRREVHLPARTLPEPAEVRACAGGKECRRC